MIKDIINLLNTSDYYVGDSDIDFAKGINKFPSTFKQTREIIKRMSYGRK